MLRADAAVLTGVSAGIVAADIWIFVAWYSWGAAIAATLLYFFFG
jgi:hypothetical protein